MMEDIHPKGGFATLRDPAQRDLLDLPRGLHRVWGEGGVGAIICGFGQIT